MADVDVDQWLEGWVENNLKPCHPSAGSPPLSDPAAACAADAAAAGIGPVDLKRAAGEDLATYLRARQNALTDAAER